jgi:DNA polymerase I-like protein with 3'-5' exonuclease and polymerase domains
MKDLITEAMEQAVNLVVPMEVAIQTASNWLEAH